MASAHITLTSANALASTNDTIPALKSNARAAKTVASLGASALVTGLAAKEGEIWSIDLDGPAFLYFAKANEISPSAGPDKGFRRQAGPHDFVAVSEGEVLYIASAA